MTHTRLFRPKLALAVTLAAIATTPAAAQVTRSAGPLVSPAIQQDSHPGCSAVFRACSGGGYTTAAAPAKWATGPFVSPAIQQGSHPGCSAVFGACSGGGYTTAAAHPSVQGVTHSDGFDWGDAGIGAAAGLGLSMLGLGGAIKVSQHRSPTPTAVATS